MVITIQIWLLVKNLNILVKCSLKIDAKMNTFANENPNIPNNVN